MTVVPARADDALIATGLARLLKAYPTFLDSVDGDDLVWHDGTRMPLGAVPVQNTLLKLDAGVYDMLQQPYPVGAAAAPPARDFDPGRIRPAPLFEKMYGDCRTGGSTKNLTDVVWLPKKWGKPLKVSRVNGAADQLRKVSDALDALPAKFDRYLFPSAGTYNCRPIAGTTRISAHGYGIAIDLALPLADYWRWQKDGGRDPAYRNRLPVEIVAIFEAHGFIWGGRWHHYDTMHFEYRPELIDVAK